MEVNGLPYTTTWHAAHTMLAPVTVTDVIIIQPANTKQLFWKYCPLVFSNLSVHTNHLMAYKSDAKALSPEILI